MNASNSNKRPHTIAGAGCFVFSVQLDSR